MHHVTSKLSFLLVFLLLATLGMAQNTFSTVGIIGSATTGGWDESTPMNPSANGDPHQWVLTLRLIQGEAKFRADDSWAANWGASAFPGATGQPGGPNIPIPATGYYTVYFNDASGNYHFEALQPPVYNTVGLIGTATSAGWGSSTPMIRSNTDPHSWSLDLTLGHGEVKFRANNDWSDNWGSSSFPLGWGTPGGSNIGVPAGDYTVTFNDVTKEYFFRNRHAPVYLTVGIIGTATADDWASSTPMKAGSDPHSWKGVSFLEAGELKFRANNDWADNWGGNSFPSGYGIRSAPGNLKVPRTGWYTIQFNDLTAAYRFVLLHPVAYGTVGIIGTATQNGWGASTPMSKGADGHTWTLQNMKLSSGLLKFRANNEWAVNWGAAGFPSGTGSQGGADIPVPAGIYNISFNDVTGDYVFERSGSAADAIVTLSPAFPGAEEPVTLTYNAGKGVSGLGGASKIYLHSGVVLNSPGGTGWSNVVGNWGQDDGVGAMTPVTGEPGKWQITLPGIRNYYSVENGQPVFRLGMVFRNADGTQTGRSDSGGDIFVDVDPGDFVRFTAPASGEIFALSGEPLFLSAEASGSGSLTLEIDEGNGFQTVKQVTSSQAIDYTYSARASGNLKLRVTAFLNGKTVSSERSLNLVVRNPVTVAPLPAGLRNGINYHPADPSKATLVLLAPKKKFAYVVGDFNNWTVGDAYQMKQTPDGESFWLELNNLEAQKEYVFQYWVEGTIKIGDPYADKVADPYNDNRIPVSVYPGLPAYTRTANGIATVLQTGQESYSWKFPGVKGGRPAKENLVVYELLVRDFLRSHSYKELADSLAYLKRLGVNAIELMPIMEFEGNESWGYNSSYLFAPDKYYGSKNDLKAFIDKAHEEGFVVLLDMVLNHQFGQSPMVRLYWDEANNRPLSTSPWFNPEATHPFNVGYDFNHESAYTKRYIDDVNRYWIEEYKFDGYRFDLTKGFTQVNNPNDVGAWSRYDQSRIDILKRMTDKIRETDPKAYVIFEHLSDNEEEKVLADYGIMLWGNMNHPYNDVINGHTGASLDWTLSATRGWSQKNVMAYMESHDEERLLVRAKNDGLGNGDYSIRKTEVALDRVKLASAFFYTLPGPKMLWQFGELGYDVPIDFNGRTGNKPLPWGGTGSLNYDKDEDRIRLNQATAAIIKLVNDHSAVFEEGNFSWTPTGQFRRINLQHADMNVAIAGNFGVTGGSMQPAFADTGTWYDYFSGKAFRISSTAHSITLDPGEFRIYVDKPVSFPEPGLVTSSITCVTATATAGTITCYNGTTLVTVTGNGGKAPYTGTGTFVVKAGKHWYQVVDANGCISTVSVTLTEPAELKVHATNNNEQLYFGYTGDQAAVLKAMPSGGVAPYKVTITMNRGLICNAGNEAGDETWTVSGGVTNNHTCAGVPESVGSGIGEGGSYGVTVSLLEEAWITLTVTDANGCTDSRTFVVRAEDVRCLAGKSGASRISVCHKTGSAKNPCVLICVDPEDLEAHLAHGDYVGNCQPDCAPPPAGSRGVQGVSAAELILADTELGIRVLNNPAQSGTPFRLKLESANRQERIVLRIISATGAVLERRLNLSAGQTVALGAAYGPGIYLAEVQQGQKRSLVKLVKQ